VWRDFSGQLQFPDRLWVWIHEPGAGRLYRHVGYRLMLDYGHQPNMLRLPAVVIER
jgi:hypothetical protein